MEEEEGGGKEVNNQILSQTPKKANTTTTTTTAKKKSHQIAEFLNETKFLFQIQTISPEYTLMIKSQQA